MWQQQHCEGKGGIAATSAASKDNKSRRIVRYFVLWISVTIVFFIVLFKWGGMKKDERKFETREAGE